MPVLDITPLPTPPSRGQSPSTFVADADAFFDALPNFVDEVNAAGDEIDASVTAAAASSAAAAAAATATTVGTSTTSVAIGTGSKAFTTQAGKNWIVGTYLIIASAANPANFMTGQVTAYSGTSLTVNVIAVGGSGTLADWNIGLAGAQGATGATGANGAGAWTQIGSAVATTSGTTWSFTSIPDTYQDLLFVIDGFSVATGTGSFQILISDNNGSNYSAAINFSGTALDAASAYDGAVVIHRYNGPSGLLSGSIALAAANRTVAATQSLGGAGWRADAGIDAVRFTTSNTAVGDAGSITLYGR